MEHQREEHLLQQYATLTNSKILVSQADLHPTDHAMPEMLPWCRRFDSIVVLQNGTILCDDPSSRIIQNCKIVMINKGLTPGDVLPATKSLITMLLDNAPEEFSVNLDEHSVSKQQQRLRLLIKEALDLDASDIHIEVRKQFANIRLRKHGELFLHARWQSRLAKEVASVAFNKETDHAISHFNPSVPQNASMPMQIDDREIRLRLASLPAHEGYDVVMRILPRQDDQIQSLESLGYLPNQIDLIKRAIVMPHGAVILAGPTGSGKTTTLASCMNLVNAERKVYTIEDPVEKLIPTATQIPVNTEHNDRSFASMARTVLRMDPDVLVLGEMRDEDTASVMARAAITGHLVFSTVHTNTATGIVTRLIDLGVSNALLANPNLLVCLMCQRLAPILCEHCSVPVESSALHQPHLEKWTAVLGESMNTVRARGHDCEKCHSLGISGRKVVAEIIWMDERSREFIQSGDMLGWRHYLEQQGWVSYKTHVLSLVKQGQLDPLDAEKLMGEISNQNDVAQFMYV